MLSSGDKVPADLRLVDVRDLQVSEAGLTGESVPVQKAVEPLAAETVLADRLNMVYAGSLVTFGQAQGLVVATADRTETGRISHTIYYLLSISQLVPSLFARLRNPRQPIASVPAIGIGCALVFQIIFSQLTFINPILDTQPLDLRQAIVCIGAGVPVVIPALLLKRFAPIG
jgi:P-type E1-E2 ATPase